MPEQERYGSGNWTLAEIQQQFTPPVIPIDATTSDLRRVNAECASLYHKAIWEKRKAAKKTLEATRRFERTYKEVHLALAKQNRASSSKACDRMAPDEVRESAETYIGDYVCSDGAVVPVNVPVLKDAMQDAEYEEAIWEDVVKDIVHTSKESADNGFNLSVEGKYGGTDPTSRGQAKTGPSERPWEVSKQ